MFKRIIWILISITGIAVIYFGIIIYQDFTNDDVQQKENITANEDEEAQAAEDDRNNNDNDTNLDDNNQTNPFNQNIPQPDLTDQIIQDYIHKMSHQKVTSDVKWGFYEITNERINWLLEGIDATNNNLKNKDTYQSILKRWRDGDFSQVDQDHNAIWELQDGTIGKATGILSEEEEQEYIETTEEGE